MDSETFMSLGSRFWITISVIVVSTYVALVITRRRRGGRQKNIESPLELDDLLLDTNVDDGDHWDSDSFQEVKKKKLPVARHQEQQQKELKNVFHVKQSPPNVGTLSHAAASKNGEKPFKSSYYYAHNQHRKTGGYSDGLKAEDYEMNKPKLLAKTKASVLDTSTTTSTTTSTSTTTQAAAATAFLDHDDSIPINKYLWDDEGKENGVAKIYIDTLPGKATWDSQITKDDVVCKLVGTWKNGLVVQIHSMGERYHLVIPRMYGEVEEVKTILKPHKLIVKLLKKKNNKENLRAWPQLSSTIPSMTKTS